MRNNAEFNHLKKNSYYVEHEYLNIASEYEFYKYEKKILRINVAWWSVTKRRRMRMKN